MPFSQNTNYKISCKLGDATHLQKVTSFSCCKKKSIKWSAILCPCGSQSYSATEVIFGHVMICKFIYKLQFNVLPFWALQHAFFSKILASNQILMQWSKSNNSILSCFVFYGSSKNFNILIHWKKWSLWTKHMQIMIPALKWHLCPAYLNAGWL